MGMFDYLKCEYPLPVEGANDLEYQTKDTPAQYMDIYTIRADGTLWYRPFSDQPQEWEPAPDFTGEIRFGTTTGARRTGSIEWSAYFEAGKVVRMNLIEHVKPEGQGNG